MSRHFYAVYWPYGVNTFNFDHEPIGTVVPFDTAKARNAYVAADRFDGNFHRSVPDYRLTRKMMLEALREFRSLDSKGYEGWRVDGVFYESLGDVYKAMFDADAQLRYELFGDVDSREA